MNDIEKAIEALKMDNELMQFDPNTGEDYPIELQNEINQDIYKANLVAISVLEKQAPKNAMGKGSTKEVGYCPNCKSHLMYEPKTNYCRWCGQRLSWEVENEQRS